VIEHALVGLTLVLGLAGGYLIARSRLRGHRSERPDAVHRILLPFTGTEVSRRALDAALRLALAEGATLMPAYLAQVPKSLPLACAIPKEAAQAMPMLEAIEQRARAQGVAVDARIERGRSYRHALARLLATESFDRVLVPARAGGGEGLSGEDLVWLLAKAPVEVLILRPGPEDRRVLSAGVPPRPVSRRPRSPDPSAARRRSPASPLARSG
jgi:nucleotide-binding universal stress UspA family protein